MTLNVNSVGKIRRNLIIPSLGNLSHIIVNFKKMLLKRLKFCYIFDLITKKTRIHVSKSLTNSTDIIIRLFLEEYVFDTDRNDPIVTITLRDRKSELAKHFFII